MSGRWFTVGTLLVCAGLVSYALWQRSQDTARVREFWTPGGAQLIQRAPRVALRLEKSFTVHDDPPSLADEAAWLDLSTAPGLVHLRATLVEDRYYRWPAQPATDEECAAHSPRYRVLRFEGTNGFIDVAINMADARVVNLSGSRAVEIIPSSHQALVAFLRLVGNRSP